MNRMRSCALALPLLALCTVPLSADVKTRERSQVKLEGFLGRMAGMFGGRAAREGIVTTTAVRGDRKVEMGDTTGRIIDLREEKIYELDVKRRTYQVTTFEELRRRMREAQEKAARERSKEDPAAGREEAASPAAEMDVDVDVRESGQKKMLAGHDAREVVLAVTLRQKGRTLEDGGGMVMTSNMWLGPDIPAMKELTEFELRYWKAIAPEAAGMSAEQLAMLTAMYPMMSRAMERLTAESSKLDGTPLATTIVVDAVRSKEQMSQQPETRGGRGGIGGMLAGRLMKREEQPRATIFTTNHEILEITPAVSDAELEIPADFKERK